jgi:hypothetical protein
MGILWLLVRSFNARVDASGQTALSLSRRNLAAESAGGFVAESLTERGDAPDTTDDEAVQVMQEDPAAPTSPTLECWPEAPASASPAGASAASPDEETEGLHEKFPTEVYTLRLLQVILFVCAYACARTLGDPADWKSRPDQVVLVCCVFGIIFFLLGSMLPGLVPTFAALMAMPPYVDRQNADLFLAVLAEHKRPVDESASWKGDRMSTFGSMLQHKGTGGGSMAHHLASANSDVVSSLQSPDHQSKARVLLGGSMTNPSTLPHMLVNCTSPCFSALGQGQQATDAEWQHRMASQVEDIHRKLLCAAEVATIKLPPVRAAEGPMPPEDADVFAPAGEPAFITLPSPSSRVAHRSMFAQIAVLRRELERLEGLIVDEELPAQCSSPTRGDKSGDVAALLSAELNASGGG